MTIETTLRKPQELIRLEAESDALLREIARTTVENEQEYKQANDWLARVRGFLKGAEERRKQIVGPKNNEIRAINAAFVVVLTSARQAETNLDNGILAFYYQQQELQRREQARLDKHALKVATRAEERGEQSAIPEVIPAIAAEPEKTTVTEAGKVGMVTHRKWRILDAKLVPPEYWMLDEVKIGKMVRAGIPSIPGVQIWEETGTAVRR